MVSPIERIAKALEIAKGGMTDGAHHKMWVIDQMVRALHEDRVEYVRWVKELEAGEDGPKTYEWDEGIVP